MTTLLIVFFVLFFSKIHSYTDDSINLLVHSSTNSTNDRRYCVELAKLPNDRTINITSFGWHKPYLASPYVNACNTTDLENSLPQSLPFNTILIIYEHQCKMTEHAWNVEQQYRHNISLMILTNRTNTNYELTYNTTAMPVSIPVLIFLQNDLNTMMKIYNINTTQMSIDYPLFIPKKFRPGVLLMFLLVFFILICGNHWAADEFVRKIKNRNLNIQSESTSSNISPGLNDTHEELSNNNNGQSPTLNNENTHTDTQAPRNNEPAIIYMPYCIIAVILCFAIGWLLLIYYFPKVMIYILQAMFCLGAFSSLTSCIDRLSFFIPTFRRYRIPSHTFQKPCTCQIGPLNIFTMFAMMISIAVIAIWYIYRHAEWAWILQDILGIAICITITSVYRLGNMRVITLILVGFFLYDIFFVFITPYIPFFQSDRSGSSKTTTTTIAPTIASYNTQKVGTYKKVSRNPSVMEQVALGFGTNGEIVPLLFALPMFIPESEIDPCVTFRKSMLGFGDVILPGILLTFCKIFDIASGNRWPIYYIQSLISYFIGLSLTHVALYVMNTAQPALLYLVPCILLSTIITGLCRGELKELYVGKRIQLLLDDKPKTPESLLAASDNSTDDQTQQSVDVVIGISDAIGTVAGVENR